MFWNYSLPYSVWRDKFNHFGLLDNLVMDIEQGRERMFSKRKQHRTGGIATISRTLFAFL
jgi:hypothetical protein